MTHDQKARFLREEYIPLLQSLDPAAVQMGWGKLSLQGTVEHMADSVRIASGMEVHDPMYPPEQTEKMRLFMLSDRSFREGTTSPLMGAEAPQLRWQNYADSVGELQTEIADFFDVFAEDRQRLITNPFFGALNFEQWVHLLHKHAWHHLRQAGVAPAADHIAAEPSDGTI